MYNNSDGSHLGIIDTQGNELYSVSSNEDEYDCFGSCQGVYLIWKHVRNMTEDAAYLYVIDKKGQEVISPWRVSGEEGVERAGFTVQAIGDGLICYQSTNSGCIVDLKNKKYYESGIYFADGAGTALMQSGSALAVDWPAAGFNEKPSVYDVPSSTGYPIYQITYDDLTDATAWENRSQNRFDLSKLGCENLRSLGQDMVFAQRFEDMKSAVYNAVTGEKLFDLDFGENTTVNTCRGSGDYIYAEIKGADGRRYYCVLNRKGEKLYEPICGESGNLYFDQGYVLDVIIGSDREKTSMTSRDGKVVRLKDGIDFIGEDEVLFREGDINTSEYTDKALVSDGYIWLEYFGYRNLSTGKSITKVGVEE